VSDRVASKAQAVGSDTEPTPITRPESNAQPLVARNFYKLEKWTMDGKKVDSMLYAGNNLAKAQELFARAIKHRPRIKLTIRQRTRVLQQWPETA